MEWWHNFLWNVIYIPQIVLILNVMFGMEIIKKKNRWILFGLLEFFLAIICKMTGNYSLIVNVVLITAILFSLLCMKGKFKIVKTFIVFLVLMAMLHHISKVICLVDKRLEIVSVIIGMFLVVILMYAYKKFELKSLSSKSNKIIKLVSGGMLITGVFASVFPITDSENLHNIKILSMTIIAFVLFMVSSFLIVLFSVQNNNYRINEIVSKEKEILLTNYFNDVKKHNYEMRRFKHDYKNHIGSIKYLLNEKRFDEAEEYVNKLCENEWINEKIIDVGHDFVNAILSDYHKKATEKEIEINVSGVIPLHIQVDNVDWSTILTNSIGNALEATEKLEGKNKKIDISFRSLDNKLFIQMFNNTCEKVIITDGKIKTTKNNKENHGFGIDNIRATVRKYYGNLEYEFFEEEQLLKTQILICK